MINSSTGEYENIDIKDRTLRDNILDLIYPIGSIYMSINDTSPEVFIGGTWERISQGRCIMGAGTVEDNNDTTYGNTQSGSYTLSAEQMGGEYQHTLTVDQMPTHKHTYGVYRADEFGHVPVGCHIGSFTLYASQNTFLGYTDRPRTETANSGLFDSAGGSQAHNNMPPYIAVYIWKRTA